MNHTATSALGEALPNFTLKLVRPGFGPAAELPTSSRASRRHGGCSSAGVACNFSPATAAPLRLRHAGPAAQLSVRSVGRTPNDMRVEARVGSTSLVASIATQSR